MPNNFLLQVAVMAAVTYLIRAVPLALCRGQLQSRWLRDFLYYVPYAVLGAMTFPTVFSSTASPLGVAVGIALAWMEKGLLTVAVAACAAVFLAERFL